MVNAPHPGQDIALDSRQDFGGVAPLFGWRLSKQGLQLRAPRLTPSRLLAERRQVIDDQVDHAMTERPHDVRVELEPRSAEWRRETRKGGAFGQRIVGT
jgi:hypothetical protein